MTDTLTIPPHVLSALSIIKTATRGTFFLDYALVGPSARYVRQLIMGQLLFQQHVPLSKCGINALERELYRWLDITGGCIAERQSKFIDLCKSLPIP